LETDKNPTLDEGKKHPKEVKTMNTMGSAAQQGDIDSLYRLIAQNPRVLEDIDSTPFVQTPLHVAACAGHVQFATEIMTLKPSLLGNSIPKDTDRST